MTKNILFVSLNSCGTKGHYSLIRKAIAKLKDKFTIFEVSDSDSTISMEGVTSLKITQQETTYSAGGSITYRYAQEILDIIEKHNVHAVIFSTFFDPVLVRSITLKKVQTMLISYPLRDSHRASLILRDELKYFNRIIWLTDITPDFEIESKQEICASPIPPDCVSDGNQTSRILVSCGGGGRPSRKRFYSVISDVITDPRMSKFDFTIIDPYDAIKTFPPNCIKIKWSDNFHDLLCKASFVISEAGYHTISELVSIEKPAIIIPGARRIDNQELRAVYFEKLGCGKFLFPEEDSKKLIGTIMEMKSNLKSYNFEKAKAEMFKNPSLDIVLEEEIQ